MNVRHGILAVVVALAGGSVGVSACSSAAVSAPCNQCVPGDVKACACIGGDQGVQACKEDGCGWEACEGCAGSATGGVGGGAGGDDYFVPDSGEGDESLFGGGEEPQFDSGVCVQVPVLGYHRGGYKFGQPIPNKPGRYHGGEDVHAPTGTTVYAVWDGTVRWASQISTWGYLVEIDHVAPDGTPFIGIYGHLGHGLKVSVGDSVAAGQVLGNTGSSAENGGWPPHLHFGVFTGSPPASGVLHGHVKTAELPDYADPIPWLNIHGTGPGCGSPGDQPATATLTAPLDGATITGPFQVTGSATDLDGLAKVTFSLDAHNVWSCDGNCTGTTQGISQLVDPAQYGYTSGAQIAMGVHLNDSLGHHYGPLAKRTITWLGAGCQVCSPGQTQCSGQTIQTCVQQGACTAWQATQTCSGSQTCQNGQCVTAPCNGCLSNGACVAGSSNAACGANGAVCQACSAGQTCQNGQCTCQSTCSPGQTQCSGQTVQTCAMQGGCYAWQSGQTCSGSQTCQNGQCTCQSTCSPGQTQCSGQTVQTCAMQGGCYAWQSGQTCSGSQTCQNGQCTCGAASAWSPSSSSDLDPDGTQYNNGSSVILGTGLRLEIAESATPGNLKLRICKVDANNPNIANSIDVYFRDSTYGTVMFSGTLAPNGTCTVYGEMSSESNYSSGQTLNGSWRAVSPSTSVSGWTTQCTKAGAADPTGTCWWDTHIAPITRTCL